MIEHLSSLTGWLRGMLWAPISQSVCV